MEQGGALLAVELRVGVVQDEADGREKVGLAGAVSADNNVAAWAEWLYYDLVAV
jgi:hypothetical protein